MYQLSDYIPYTGKLTNGSEIVVAWSKKDGYYFTEFGFCVESLVIAIEEV